MTDRPNFSKGKPNGPATPPAKGDKPAPPKLVVYAAAALLLSGIAAVLASATLYSSSVKSWVRDNTRDSVSDTLKDKFDDVKKAGPSGGERAGQLSALQNEITKIKSTPSTELTPVATNLKSSIAALKPGAAKKGKDALGDMDKQATNLRDIDDQIAKQQKGALISSIVVFVALGIAAGAAYRGRYWARWATLGLWVLATFTGTLAGIGSVLSVGADIPGSFKAAAFISGLALVAAVVLVNLRPCVAYFNLSRPERGARPQRRGLFSPPPPRTPRQGASAKDDASTGGSGSSGGANTANPDRARTKQRSSDAAVSKGADLARSRAKASKSRRTGV